MAKSLNQNSVIFSNVKTESEYTTVGAGLKINGVDGVDPNFGGIINAVDIDWNGAKPGMGEGTNGITTTGELLGIIKSYADTKSASNHTHNLTLATDSGTPTVTLSPSTTYKLTAGGKSLIFKTPADANTTYSLANLIGSSAIGNTTKPIYWNGSSFVAANNYPSGVSTLTLTKTGTSTIDLLANTTYTLTVGDKTLAFKTPTDQTGSAADGNTWRAVYVGSTSALTNNISSGNLKFDGGEQINPTWDSTNKVIKFNHYRTDGRSYGANQVPGLYKFASDAWGHIIAGASVTKSDITALGIPAQDTNTTYKLTLNGTVKGTTGGTDLGTIYAPTSLGNAGQVLKVNSAGTGLTWATDNTGSSTTINAATLKSLLVAGPNIAIKAWSDLTDEEKTIYGDSSIGMSDGKLIIINTYQPIDMYYKIQFNKNGGTGTLPSNMGPYASGTMVQIPSVSLTRSGYTLSGWNTKTDGSGTSYAFNSTYVVPSNTGTLTLYAKWIANKTNPTLTINNPASTTIADGKTTTITVTSSVAGKLTLTTSSGTGWSATSSSSSTAATSHTITVSNLTSTATAGSISVGGIVATFTPTDTSSYNTLTNQSVLKQAITLSAKPKTNPTLTINNPSSTTIADGKTTTITVTSSVAGKLTLTTSSGTGWSATSSSTSTAATSHTITVSNLTSTTAAGSIAVDGIVATFTPTDTTNYNTLTNQSVLKQAITLSAAVATNTYYYYAGWTQPTASNVDTVIAETYPSASGSTTMNAAGKKTTSKSSFSLSGINLYNASAKTNYYVLVPTGHAIYDTVFGGQFGNDAFTSQGTITVGNQIHTIYKSVGTTRNIVNIEIK